MNATALLSLERTGPQADANRLRLRAAMFKPYDAQTAARLIRVAKRLEEEARAGATTKRTRSRHTRSR